MRNDTDTILLSRKILEILGRIQTGELTSIPDINDFLHTVVHYESRVPVTIDIVSFTALLEELQRCGLVESGDLAAGYCLTPEGEASARAMIYARDNDDEEGNVCLLRME